MSDTFWCGSEADKLYLQSGQFTSTIKASQAVGDDLPADISYNNVDTYWCGTTGVKLFQQSGAFTSTIKDSLSVASIDNLPYGVSLDAVNTPWCGGQADKLYLQSDQFTSTLKTSEAVTTVDTSPTGISYDGANTPWSGAQTRTLYLQSDQFTSTIKTSEDVETIDNNVHSISWDGVNTPWGGLEADKLYLQSEQFTSTLKTSLAVGAIDNAPCGIEDSSFSTRIGGITGTASNSITFGQTLKLEIPGQVSNSITFGQAVQTQSDFEHYISHTISFSQSHLREFPVHASNEIEFFNITRTQFYFIYTETEITFDTLLRREIIVSQRPESIIRFGHHGGRGFNGVGSNSISFTQAVGRGDHIVSNITFGQNLAEQTASQPPDTSMGFVQSVRVNKIVQIYASNSISFGQAPAAAVTGDCELGHYEPGGDLPARVMGSREYITLSFAAESIDLRNPEFGNTEAPQVQRAYNTMRGGDVRVFRDSARPDSTMMNLTIQMMSTAKVTELYAFLRECIGQEITFVDQDNRTWTGIILNPNTAISTDRDGSCGPRTATLEMVMDPS